LFFHHLKFLKYDFVFFLNFHSMLVTLFYYFPLSTHSLWLWMILITFHSLFVTLDDFNHFPLLMGFTMKTHLSFSPYSFLINVFLGDLLMSNQTLRFQCLFLKNLASSNNIDLWVYFFCFQLACLIVENWKLMLLDFVKV
jgi:hypothetical protein